jgi:hypothetical protein
MCGVSAWKLSLSQVLNSGGGLGFGVDPDWVMRRLPPENELPGWTRLVGSNQYGLTRARPVRVR